MGPTLGAHSLVGCLWAWTPGGRDWWMGHASKGGTTAGIIVPRTFQTWINAQPGGARGHVCLGLVLSRINTWPGGAHGYVRRSQIAMGMHAPLMAFSPLRLVIPHPLCCPSTISVGDSFWIFGRHPFGGNAPYHQQVQGLRLRLAGG